MKGCVGECGCGGVWGEGMCGGVWGEGMCGGVWGEGMCGGVWGEGELKHQVVILLIVCSSDLEVMYHFPDLYFSSGSHFNRLE